MLNESESDEIILILQTLDHQPFRRRESYQERPYPVLSSWGQKQEVSFDIITNDQFIKLNQQTTISKVAYQGQQIRTLIDDINTLNNRCFNEQNTDSQKNLNKTKYSSRTQLTEPAQPKNSVQDESIQVSFTSKETQKNNKPSRRQIFSPLRQKQIKQQIYLNEMDQISQSCKNTLVKHKLEMFCQLSQLKSQDAFKTSILTSMAQIFDDGNLRINFRCITSNNGIEVKLIYQNHGTQLIKNISFTVYSDSTLNHQTDIESKNHLSRSTPVCQTIQVIPLCIPFTFVEINGEYNGNNYFKLILPISILNFCHFEKITGKVVGLKMSSSDYDPTNLQKILDYFKVKKEESKSVFSLRYDHSDELSAFQIKIKGSKVSLICKQSSYAETLLNTIYFLIH